MNNKANNANNDDAKTGSQSNDQDDNINSTGGLDALNAPAPETPEASDDAPAPKETGSKHAQKGQANKNTPKVEPTKNKDTKPKETGSINKPVRRTREIRYVLNQNIKISEKQILTKGTDLTDDSNLGRYIEEGFVDEV